MLLSQLFNFGSHSKVIGKFLSEVTAKEKLNSDKRRTARSTHDETAICLECHQSPGHPPPPEPHALWKIGYIQTFVYELQSKQQHIYKNKMKGRRWGF